MTSGRWGGFWLDFGSKPWMLRPELAEILKELRLERVPSWPVVLGVPEVHIAQQPGASGRKGPDMEAFRGLRSWC